MKKIIFLIVFPINLFSAALFITSDTNTAVMLYLDNGTKRSDFVLTSKPYQTDAIFAGFSTIVWLGKDGTIYGARINILGLDGMRSLKINNDDNSIYVGGNLLNKLKGSFQGVPVNAELIR